MSALNSAVLLNAWEDGWSQPLVQRALILLAAMWPEQSADEWAQVSIGERDRWLIRLHEELFGTRLETTAVCPQCADHLETNFSTTDIRVAPPTPALESGLVVEVSGYEVACHLPTSADLLQITSSPVPDMRDALLKRCIEVARYDGGPMDPATLPQDIASNVMEQMAKADPQADVRVEIMCPACAHLWSLPFDILSYLWNEIEDYAQRLLWEVHTLASVYGWSESDIVTMTPQRRQIYLDMIGS